MDKTELLKKLAKADEDAYFARSGQNTSQKASAVIVGGSALLLCDLSAKATTKDVDIYQIAADKAAREALYADPNFNSQCQAYTQNMPYNFEDRLVLVKMDTLAIDYYVPSPEDLAVMKLYRWEPPDVADLTAPTFLEKLDWNLLERLVYHREEAEASRSALPERDRELSQMRWNFEDYRRRYRQ